MGHHDKPHHHHGPDVPEQHKARGPKSVRAWVVTCSDTRTAENDEGGNAIQSMLAAKGHAVAGSAIVKDEPERIAEQLERARAGGAQVVLFTGGTGISS